MKIWLFSYEEVISKGTNPRLLGYYKYLQEHGHTPCFCFLKGPEDIHSEYDFRAPVKAYFGPLQFVVSYFFTVLLYKPCDIAYFYGPNALFIPLYLVCKLRGVRIVIEKVELDSIKKVESWKDIVNRRLNQLDEWFAPRIADSLIVISTKLLQFYDRWVDKTSLIGAFIPYHSLHKPVASHHEKKYFTVGYFGSFADKDDLETLLKAFNYVKQNQPKVNLKLIGSPTPKWKRRIDLPGVISVTNVANTDIHQHLLACDVLIAIRKDTAYAHHGFPSKLAEYIVTGIPIITTPTSDIPTIFQDHDLFTLVPHSDFQALGEAILHIWNNPETYQDKAISAHQWAMDNWDPNVVLKEWEGCVLGV